MGFSLAIPAAALCVLHQLESIVSARQAQFLKSDRRKRQKIEALICFGFPILFMALRMCNLLFESHAFMSCPDYVVQGHRFDLIEDFGCQPAVYDSVVALCLIYLPPLLISVTSLSFAGQHPSLLSTLPFLPSHSAFHRKISLLYSPSPC